MAEGASCGDDAADGGAGLVRESNAASNVRTHSGRFTIRKIILVAMPSVPSEPTKLRRGRSRGHREFFPRRGGRASHRQNNLKAKDMRRGETVFEAMRAAGIFGDIATDSAHRLRRGVRRIEEFIVLNARGDIEIEDARLRRHACVGKIHFEDAVHANQADDDAVLDRRRSAAQAGARASRDKRDSFPVTDADDGLNLFSGSGQEDRAGQHAEINQAIALIGVKLFGGGDQAATSTIARSS